MDSPVHVVGVTGVAGRGQWTCKGLTAGVECGRFKDFVGTAGAWVTLSELAMEWKGSRAPE